ncbi:MAG TPA: lysoplasmalogenase [Chitinophagaceae bacterium]|jgi:uncharacterized membrane protein YhhN
MKKITWIILFLTILFINLIAVYYNYETLRFLSKVLLVPVLGAYLINQTASFNFNLKPWILIALFFSWLGDILLMFEEKRSIFFLLGLGAFFIAQVFYIIFFHGIRMREYIRGNALLLLLVVIYYAVLIGILSPHLGNLTLPVRIYGVVLSFMLLLAMHSTLGKNKRSGWWMTTGAIFFVISDSLLAFNKFLSPFEYAGVIIMVTYGLAQLFITHGAIKYMRGE